jgi:septum formation protein
MISGVGACRSKTQPILTLLNQILKRVLYLPQPFIDPGFNRPLRYLGSLPVFILLDMPNSTNVTTPRVWLASQSPRRAQLLHALGIPFQTLVSEAEEADIFGGSVENTVLENARRKGRAVLAKVTAETDIVIAADTLVALGDRILSKPVTPKEALESLRGLSGNSHRVLTGLALSSRTFGTRDCVVETKVRFRKLTEAEMLAYTQTREPYDKAGGYGIQGLACLFVDRVEGSYSNVMGLPIERLLTELEALTSLPAFQWAK